MFDPYAHDAPSVADPANNIIDLTPDDDNDLATGVKALRLFNTTNAVATLAAVTITGNTVALKVPANALVVEPLRIKRLLETTTAGLEVQGYTDYE